MTIPVTTHDTTTTSPLVCVISDRSAAHTIVTLTIAGQPPISHVFDHHEGELKATVEVPPGKYVCSFVVQAFLHGALGPMVDCAATINGAPVARALGSIPAGKTNDIGFGDFAVTVV